jgi:hypothetical protein
VRVGEREHRGEQRGGGSRGRKREGTYWRMRAVVIHPLVRTAAVAAAAAAATIVIAVATAATAAVAEQVATGSSSHCGTWRHMEGTWREGSRSQESPTAIGDQHAHQ